MSMSEINMQNLMVANTKALMRLNFTVAEGCWSMVRDMAKLTEEHMKNMESFGAPVGQMIPFLIWSRKAAEEILNQQKGFEKFLESAGYL